VEVEGEEGGPVRRLAKGGESRGEVWPDFVSCPGGGKMKKSRQFLVERGYAKKKKRRDLAPFYPLIEERGSSLPS